MSNKKEKSARAKYGFWPGRFKSAIVDNGDTLINRLASMDRFLYRARYLTDSRIIVSKAYVDRICQQFKNHFSSKHEKRPKGITGLSGVYSLKRLSDAI